MMIAAMAEVSDELPLTPVKNLLIPNETDVLARTLWGEARGEGLIGMEAVASVILNRLAISQRKKNHWWGRNIIGICRARLQFSCWNQDDINFTKLSCVGHEDAAFACAMRIAQRAVNGFLPDNTSGATHYHHRKIFPAWAKGQTPTTAIGNHVFYRLEE